MAAVVAGADVADGSRSEDRGESLAEWRLCEQVDNGSPSTSPPFWDSDGEDEGPKPSELYQRYEWKIENFSKEKKREMKSDLFEAGGYKWYILVYPQGCDVSNHLSLFLCVANHDKLLPGWSHFAQFTIAVANVEPKKIKYSDTLHRFWKKEHDWGWKKFMELSKIQEGFLIDDVLQIIAQVQVIREKADRPFRCLDRPYRRELLRVYMKNIELIYRHFVEEKRSKLCKLIEDKVSWCSFRAFWLNKDMETRDRMSREKADAILKVVVKHFFVEKEVTSTLVMDSLYTGFKALEYQSKGGNKGKEKLVDLDELPTPMVILDSDVFVLASDVITLLERAALEPLPCQPPSPKDEKYTQSRTKDGCSGEVSRVSIEREERRLTELGRKILEISVLSHIFGGIEVAYQEAVALKRQEELIREEEAAGQLENEMKGRRGATEKEKRAKKKQAKQKKNNRRGKDKEKEDKHDVSILDKSCDQNPPDAIDDGQPDLKVDAIDEGASDLSDSVDASVEVHQQDLVENEVEPSCGELDIGQVGSGDNSSACFAEAEANHIQSNGNTSANGKSQSLQNRTRNQRNKGQNDRVSTNPDGDNFPSSNTISCENTNGLATVPEQEAFLSPQKDQVRLPEPYMKEKDQVLSQGKKQNGKRQVVGSSTKAKTTASSSGSLERPANWLKRTEQPNDKTVSTPTDSTASSPAKVASVSVADSPARITSVTPVSHAPPARGVLSAGGVPAPAVLTSASSTASTTPMIVHSTAPAIAKAERTSTRDSLPNPTQMDKPIPSPSRIPDNTSTSSSEAYERTTSSRGVSTQVTANSQAPPLPRPGSAPLIQDQRLNAPTVSAQVTQMLSRSVSEAGQGGRSGDPSPSNLSYIPLSYRNAIVGKPSFGGASMTGFNQPSTSLGNGVVPCQPFPAYTSPASALLLPSTRKDQVSVRPSSAFAARQSEMLSNWQPWKDDTLKSATSVVNQQSWRDDGQIPSSYGLQNEQFQPENIAVTSQALQATAVDEFPHLDIINDLLEEEHSDESTVSSRYQNYLAFGSPFSLHASMSDSELPPSTSSRRSAVLGSQYYGDGHGYGRRYDGLGTSYHRLRDMQFPPLDIPTTYANGADALASKPWLYGFPSPSANVGVSTSNGYSHQIGDYANLANGVQGGDSVYRRTNGHW